MTDKTICKGCWEMTHSIRKSRALWICDNCGNDKTFGDLMQDENKIIERSDD